MSFVSLYIVLCNKPIYRIGLVKNLYISVLKSTKTEYRNIGISISTTILANIGLKWYYRVQVVGYFVDFVPYKYQTKSKIIP